MQRSGTIHCCHVADAFKLEQGRITRDRETEFWQDVLQPIVIDIETGIVQLGREGTPTQWDIVQRGEPGWDFVAARAGPGNALVSTIRIRLWEAPIQMVLIVNGFTFATGVCEQVCLAELMPAPTFRMKGSRASAVASRSRAT